jgi:hypothetical protein
MTDTDGAVEQDFDQWHERLFEAGRGDMARHTTTWKATERYVAQVFGGRRMGPGGDRADVRSRWLCVEVKHRGVLPSWLKDAVAQALSYAGPAQLALAVLHEAGSRHRNDLVVLRLSDFEQWFGALELPDLEPAEVQAALESGRTIAELAGVRAEDGE